MKTITPLASSSYSNPYTVYSTGAVPSSTGVPFTGAASSNQAAVWPSLPLLVLSLWLYKRSVDEVIRIRT